MKELNKWVDVREKQVREVTDMNITIQKIENLNSYITLKEIKDLEQPHNVYINGEIVRKLDKNFTILEYTPLDEYYNVRVHINDKLEILEYYFDITNGNEIREGIPFYNDLYLDVIYYQPTATKSSTYIHLDDVSELKDALKKEIIDKEQYNFAYEITNKLITELKEGTNKFVNRELKDFFKYKTIN